MGELVRLADDEVVEGEARVERRPQLSSIEWSLFAARIGAGSIVRCGSAAGSDDTGAEAEAATFSAIERTPGLMVVQMERMRSA